MIISVNGIDEVKEMPLDQDDAILCMDRTENIFYVKSRASDGTTKIGTYSFQQEDMIYVQ